MFDRVLFDDGIDVTTKTSFNHGWELCELFEITVVEFLSYQRRSGKYNSYI